MKGYRTLIVNVVLAVLGVLVAFNWGDVLPPKYAILVTSIIIPAINGYMRMITTTPVGKDTP